MSALLEKVARMEAVAYSFCIILWDLNIAFSVHFGRTLLTRRPLNFITAGAGLILAEYFIHFIYKALQLFI